MNPLDNESIEFPPNPFQGNELNPDIELGIGQIVDELNGITNSVNAHLGRGLKTIQRRLGDIENENQSPLPGQGFTFQGCYSLPPHIKTWEEMQTILKLWHPFNQCTFEFLDGHPSVPGSKQIIGTCGSVQSMQTVSQAIAQTLIGCLVAGYDGNPICPPGYQFNPSTNQCEPIGQTQQCPNGYHWDINTNQCVPDSIPTKDGCCPPAQINVSCPKPEIKVEVNPQIQIPPIEIDWNKNPIHIDLGKVECPAPIINIENKIEVPENENKMEKSPCEKTCETFDNETEKQQCLEEICKREPNWLRYLTTKQGDKDVALFADKMGFISEFPTSKEGWTEAIGIAQMLKEITTKKGY